MYNYVKFINLYIYYTIFFLSLKYALSAKLLAPLHSLKYARRVGPRGAAPEAKAEVRKKEASHHHSLTAKKRHATVFDSQARARQLARRDGTRITRRPGLPPHPAARRMTSSLGSRGGEIQPSRATAATATPHTDTLRRTSPN